MARIVVHHLQNSRSNRILWALEELGVPYSVKVHYRTTAWFAGESLKAVTPLGKSPAVEVDGEVLTESAAILATLLERYPTPRTEWPPSVRSLFWSHFAEGSLMLYLQPARFAELGRRQVVPSLAPEEMRGANAMNDWFQAWARRAAEQALVETEAFLSSGHEMFSGSPRLGLGDFMMFFPLNSIAHGRKPGAPRLYQLGPATDAWVERMRSRPAFQRSHERMLKEEAEQQPAPRL